MKGRPWFGGLALAVGLLGLTAATGLEVVASDADGLKQVAGLLHLHGTPFTGVVTTEADDFRTRKETAYRAGLRHGESTGWYASGSIAFLRDYVSGRERGEHREWYSDGQIKSEQSFRDGLLEGVAREWFPGGRLYREATYEAGVEEGSQRMWYTDGSLRANYVVRDGRRFGLIGSKACVEETST